MQLSSSGLSSPGPARRTLLRGAGGAVALGAGIPLLSACGGSGSASDPKTVTVGSNASDAVPKKAFADIYAAYKKKSGITVDVNTKDHNTFQEQINSYLQDTPDDVFHWFAGYRMQFFAAKGLATPIGDVWKTVGGSFAMKVLSQGEDGKDYFVPLYTYPWAIFYRKSVFKQYGYEVPTTWDGDRPGVRPGDRRGADRRLHAQQGPEEQGRCRQAAGVRGHAGGAGGEHAAAAVPLQHERPRLTTPIPIKSRRLRTAECRPLLQVQPLDGRPYFRGPHPAVERPRPDALRLPGLRPPFHLSPSRSRRTASVPHQQPPTGRGR